MTPSFGFHLEADGAWFVTDPERRLTPLAGVVPSLKNGTWIALAVRASGRTTEIWANGRQLGRWTDPGSGPDTRKTQQLAHFLGKTVKAGAGRYEIDYIAVWELPAAPAPPTVAPFTNADVQRIAALPAEKQVEEVRKELIRRNPGFDGQVEPKIEDGVVTEFKVVTDRVTDIAPIRGLNALRALRFGGQPNGPLADLTPLKGMPLTALSLWDTRVQDLSPLKGMKLVWLDLNGCQQVRDLGPLKGMPVTDLHLDYCQAGDLTPLEGMPLTSLTFPACTEIRDLTPLKDMKLRFLNCAGASVSDLSPLKGMHLEDIRLTPKNITKGLDILRDMKSLKTIGIEFNQAWPAAEFWERYDRGEFK
jgi:hypothetical protein